jgi:hypothetical protein
MANIVQINATKAYCSNLLPLIFRHKTHNENTMPIGVTIQPMSEVGTIKNRINPKM